MSEQPSDRDAIRQAALDYAEGWYEGNAERMERSLHPNLAKRAIRRDPQTGEENFRHRTQEDMILGTKNGGGTAVPSDKRFYDVSLFDVYEDVASARVESYNFIDYLHLAKHKGQWVIVNVLYTANRATQ